MLISVYGVLVPAVRSMHSHGSKLVLTALLMAAAALPAQSADLLQTYREALQNDPTYAAARALLNAGQEKSVQGRANLLPLINLTGSKQYARSDYAVESFNINGVHSISSNYALQLTQPLIHWDSWQLYEQSKLQVAASETQFAQAGLDLMIRVSQAYFDVLSAQDVLESIQANKVGITEQLNFAKRNYEVGTSTITDQNEAQARFDLAVATEFSAINDLESKRSMLQQIIGHPPERLAPLRKSAPLTAPEPLNINDWVSAAEHNNYGVLGAALNHEIAKRAIAVNRAGYLPKLDLVASVNRAGNSAVPALQQPAFTDQSKNIGVQLNIPLFSGFAVTSRVREAIALEDKAGNDLEAARRSAALAARQSFLGVNSGLAQIRAYEAAEISSQSSLDSNRLGYDVGIRINIDVLNAQQQLATTRQNLAKVRYDTIMNSLRLKAAAAGLSEQDLVQINALLNE